MVLMNLGGSILLVCAWLLAALAWMQVDYLNNEHLDWTQARHRTMWRLYGLSGIGILFFLAGLWTR